MYLISCLMIVGLVVYSFPVWGDAVDMIACLMLVRSVRMVRFWSRTPRTWPGCVASCVGMLYPFLVRINSTRHFGLATVCVGVEVMLCAVVPFDVAEVRTEVADEEILSGNISGIHILHIGDSPRRAVVSGYQVKNRKTAIG